MPTSGIMATSWQSINHLNSLTVRELDICLLNAPVSPEQPSQCQYSSAKCKLNAHMTEFYHNHISLSFGKDSDDEVATEQLTAVVDVTCMPHNNPEIS